MDIHEYLSENFNLMEGRDGDVRFWSAMISSELNKVKY